MTTNIPKPWVPVLAAIVSTATPVVAQPAFQCVDHFPNKTPPTVDHTLGQLTAICFDEMAILHSGETKTAVYSVQKVDASKMRDAKTVDREGHNFYPEARLPSTHRSKPEDYRGSGYDRGHLSPAATQPTTNAMAQSFSMANIVPQNAPFNRGTWKQVEKAVQSHAARSQEPLHVFTGPVYLDEKPAVIGNGVQVPSHLFKVVVNPATKEAHGWIMPNDGTAKMEKPVAIEQIENITGINFKGK